MKYEVEIKQIEKYIMSVEAESEKEAIGKAYELYDKDKNEHHNDSDSEASAFEIDN